MTETVFSPDHDRAVWTSVVGLAGAVSGRMTVGAPGMLEDFGGFLEHCGRTGVSIGDTREFSRSSQGFRDGMRAEEQTKCGQESSEQGGLNLSEIRVNCTVQCTGDSPNVNCHVYI